MYRFAGCIGHMMMAAVLSGLPLSAAGGRALQPGVLEAESYAEIYTLTTLGDDGTFVQAQMTITNLGLGDRNATAKIVVLRPGLEMWKASMYYGPKEWAYADTPLPALRIGPCRIDARAESITYSGTLNNGTVTVTLESPASPVKPPASGAGFEIRRNPRAGNRPFYEYDMVTPFTKAQTTVVLPGKDRRAIPGRGILDHSRSVGNPRDISRGWVTFRGYRGDAFLVADYRLAVEKGRPAPGWIWRQGMPSPVAMSGLRFTEAQPGAAAGASRATVITPPDSSFQLIGGEQLCRYSFIEELGPMLGGIVKLVVGDPVTIYYRAQAKFADDPTPVPGVLELMHIE